MCGGEGGGGPVVHRSCEKIKLSVGINATLECHGHIMHYMNGNRHKPSYIHTHVFALISKITFADIYFTGNLQLALK